MPDRDPKRDRFCAGSTGRLPPRGEAGPCPDPNRIAGFVDARLLPEEQAEVEAHLVLCASCRAFVAAEDRVPEVAGTVPVGLHSRRLLAAAALVFAVAMGIVLFVRSRGPSALPTEAALIASARTLASARPDLFAGFEPLAQEERRAHGTRRERGALVLLHPAEKTLAARPTFRWEAVAGATSYEVALLTADGTRLWVAPATGPVLAFPAAQPELAPGQRYLWRLTARDAQGAESPGSRVFAVASAAEHARFEAAAEELARTLPDDRASLIKAHFALRMGLVVEAEEAARRYLASHPDDAVGRETLFRALTLAGAREADDLEALWSGSSGRR